MKFSDWMNHVEEERIWTELESADDRRAALVKLMERAYGVGNAAGFNEGYTEAFEEAASFTR